MLPNPFWSKWPSRREAGYQSLGYDVTHADDLFSREAELPIMKTA